MARRPAQNSRAAPKGATTRARARNAGKSQGVGGIPGWLWAIAGLIGGFALSQYLDHSSPEPVAAVVPKPASQSSSSAANSGASSSEGGKAGTSSAQPATPTFEFYTLLPETEVIAPNSSSGSSPEVTAKASQEAAADDAANQTKQPAATGSYMLQAASFRDIADAERLANRLKDFGLLAKITDVRANGNQIWHRVQVGPYRDTRELNRAQDLMVTQGIEPLMIRLQN
ncbi:sporulation-like protein [Salinicola endophyticus]|uniref:Sporulation-like protein n=1 Tax=Salinicola endophyticus TaxID=1949083 RepID=A0ABY8FIR1_9GAMM|nr:SPOR domain-containing protein [Salinicola endophyticus]WFF41935.1 sporulation-like protein [Salinicola endophyticus]